jgi:hypothetical protein
MTREDLLDYLISYNCKTFPLSEYGRANCVGIKNPSTKRNAYLDTPIDSKRVKDATVCQICVQLGVEIPECAKAAEPLIHHIKNKNYKK